MKTILKNVFRSSAAGAALAAVLAGCIENPGTDSRLKVESTEYQLVAAARLAGTEVLEFRARMEAGRILMKVTSIAREVIDSAMFYVQFSDLNASAESHFYRLPIQGEYLGRILSLKPGTSEEFVPVNYPIFELKLVNVQVSILQFADGVERGHPLGGVYEGAYSALDTGSYRYSGPLRGLIDADGQFYFSLRQERERGLTGALYGTANDSGTVNGRLRVESGNLAAFQTLDPDPFKAVQDSLRGSFRSSVPEHWLDSLVCGMRKVNVIQN